MKRRIVIKRLSASDLTLFEHHFRNTAGAKQKAFNLDRAVFIDLLYPGLPDRLDITKNRLPLDLSIYGPGLAGLHNLQRKILKQQKNWRLNGELIYDPEDEKGRYDPLLKDDFVVFEFTGNAEPQAARMCLIARSLPEDSDLHTSLKEKYSSRLSAHRAMLLVNETEFAGIVQSVTLSDEHPILDFFETDLLEDAVQGGSESIKKLRRRRRSRGVGKDEFERARKNAELNGRLGEEILNSWLEQQQLAEDIHKFRWEADINAVAPYDFIIFDNAGNTLRSIDAKSTSGPFENKIHISVAELEEMVYGGRPYDIYRLYNIKEGFANLRIAKNAGEFVRGILSIFEELPTGVSVDSVSIASAQIQFGEEITIHINNSEEMLPEEI